MYIDYIKGALRVNGMNLDTYVIEPLIEAAKSDLVLCGILQTKVDDETDYMIIRAICLYVDAHFKPGDASFEQKLMSYKSIINHLSMSADYMEV